MDSALVFLLYLRFGHKLSLLAQLHSLTKGSCPRHGINPETGFEEVAGLVMGSRLVGSFASDCGSITAIRNL